MLPDAVVLIVVVAVLVVEGWRWYSHRSTLAEYTYESTALRIKNSHLMLMLDKYYVRDVGQVGREEAEKILVGYSQDIHNQVTQELAKQQKQ